MSDAPSPSFRFLAAAWRAVGGDEVWLDRVEIAGQGDLPSAFAVTDLAAASVGAAALAGRRARAVGDVAAAARCRRPPPCFAVVRLLAQARGLDAAAGLGPDRRRLSRRRRLDSLHTNAARHRDAALAALGCAGERDAVAAAVRGGAPTNSRPLSSRAAAAPP